METRGVCTCVFKCLVLIQARSLFCNSVADRALLGVC